MISLTNSEHQMLLLIYQLSQGDPRTILNRKKVISLSGLGKSDGEEILNTLTKRGLIRHQIFASLCITEAGLAEAAPRRPAATTYSATDKGTSKCLQCFGTGRANCPWCQGTGRKLCGACNGSGQKWTGTSRMNPSGYGRCTFCAGGRVMCSCGGGKVVCGACGGSGNRRV